MRIFFEYLDEDIPYLQYPAKQQQQQMHVDESTSTNLVEVSAPLVVKLSGDEPLPATSIVIPHPQPIVPRKFHSSFHLSLFIYFYFSSTTTIERSI